MKNRKNLSGVSPRQQNQGRGWRGGGAVGGVQFSHKSFPEHTFTCLLEMGITHTSNPGDTQVTHLHRELNTFAPSNR